MKDKITFIYLFHNRLEYNKMVLPQIIKELKNELIKDIYIYDDMSIDGSTEYVRDLLDKNNIIYNFKRNSYNSSVKQLQEVVDICTTEYILKIDSDILIPDGYVNLLFNIIERNDKIGFIAVEESGSFPFIENKITLTETRNIGGVGLFRLKAFHSRMIPHDRYYGFTQQQWDSKYLKYWIVGATMTVLDKSESYSRVKYYTGKGWSRNVNGAKKSILDLDIK